MTILLMALCCLFGFGASSYIKEQKLKMTLFSESYCPDCIDFTEKQLLPAFSKFSSHIVVDLVPFGNAEQWYEDGHWRFRCQHGEKECYGNKLQACAILEGCGEQGSLKCTKKTLGQVLKYIACVEAAPDQKKASDNCAKKAGLAPARISSCASGDKGEQLLNLYGNRTEDFKPAIQYVPTVAINGVHDEAAENDLQAEICRMRPKLCEPSVEVVMI